MDKWINIDCKPSTHCTVEVLHILLENPSKMKSFPLNILKSKANKASIPLMVDKHRSLSTANILYSQSNPLIFSKHRPLMLISTSLAPNMKPRLYRAHTFLNSLHETITDTVTCKINYIINGCCCLVYFPF